jgi:hypothetical protein
MKIAVRRALVGDEMVAWQRCVVDISPLMANFHPEFVVDAKQNRKVVLLPVTEWECIVSELEELDDIRAYDAAQAQGGERLPFEQAVREIQQLPGA